MSETAAAPTPGEQARLAERVRAGDAGAEAEMVARYGDGLRYLLRRWTRDPALAEDLFQETFRLALEKIRAGELRQPSKLQAYLRGVARTLSTRHYQRRAPRPADAAVADLPDPAPGPLAGLLAEEKRRLVHRLLGELGQARDREILLRFYVAEERKERICADLGLTDLHFNRVLYRARRRFRRLCEARRLRRGGSR